MEDMIPEDVGPYPSEESKATTLERLIPKNTSYKKSLAGTPLNGYRQIMTFHNEGTLMSPFLGYTTDKEQAWIQEFNERISVKFANNFPVGSVNCTTAGRYNGEGGSMFAISPCFKEGGESYQYTLSAAHVLSRSEHAADPGFASWDMTAGQYSRRRSFSIVRHGLADKDIYKSIDPALHSPQVSPEKGGSLYHAAATGTKDMGHTDVMILKVLVSDDDLDADGQRPFFVPSSKDHAALSKENPLAVGVAGYPGHVSAKMVSCFLGQEVAPQDEMVFTQRVNERLLAPERKSTSFGDVVSANKTMVKHPASTVDGMSGGPGFDREAVGEYHFVHVAGKVDSKERLSNRGVGKDSPYLVCSVVDVTMHSFKGHVFKDASQKAALRSWLARHRGDLEGEGLWCKVVDAGLD